LPNTDSLPDTYILRVETIAALEGCSISTIWRRVRNGTYPKPIKQTGVTGWYCGDYKAHHARLRSAGGVAA
jgi:predicted DNA-binding transcriptional regulator AlpA